MFDLDIESQSERIGEGESSLTIGGVKIGGGSNIKNQIRDGLQQGLRKVIIDKWLDPQIRYIINNFTKMNVSIKWPDISALINEGVQLVDIIKEV